MSRRYLLLSLLIHILILGVGLSSTPTNQKESKSNQTQSHEHSGHKIIPRSIEVSLAEPELDGDLTIKKQEQPSIQGLKDCNGSYWYGGIGIHQDGLGAIEKVVTGYPAHKAGLKEGDEIISVDGMPRYAGAIKGTPGFSVRLIIFRPSELRKFEVTIVRDKICIGEI